MPGILVRLHWKKGAFTRNMVLKFLRKYGMRSKTCNQPE
jgi:hypothetical protein